MRKRIASAFCIALLTTLPLWAQPNFRVDATATAQGDVRKPVVVDVTVTNNGKDPLQGYAIVKFTPKVSSADRQKGGMTDVQEAKQPVQIAPGARQVVSFSTPFETSGTFKGRKGSFSASNISPTGDVNVDFQARFEPVSAPR